MNTSDKVEVIVKEFTEKLSALSFDTWTQDYKFIAKLIADIELSYEDNVRDGLRFMEDKERLSKQEYPRHG